jgi:DNA-binding CsgD family transcriptional regulator
MLHPVLVRIYQRLLRHEEIERRLSALRGGFQPDTSGWLRIDPNGVIREAFGNLRAQMEEQFGAPSIPHRVPGPFLQYLENLNAQPGNSTPLDTESLNLRIEKQADHFLVESASPIHEKVESATPVNWQSFTRRETQVIESLLQGHLNRQIAATLGISRRTVEKHLAAIFEKLGVDHRFSAIRALNR